MKNRIIMSSVFFICGISILLHELYQYLTIDEVGTSVVAGVIAIGYAFVRWGITKDYE